METAKAAITKDDVARLVEARPFRPFSLILDNGDRFRVSHPECAEIVDGRLVVTDGEPRGRCGAIVRIELDPVVFGPIPRRKAKRHEVEAVLALAERFGATPDDVRFVAASMGAGVGATWAAMRLAAAEGLTSFAAVRTRAAQLAAIREEPGRLDPGWLAIVRTYGACVLATMVGEHLATNAQLGLVAGLSAGSVGSALKPLEEAGLIERVYERGLVGPRKIRAVDFAVEDADATP